MFKPFPELTIVDAGEDMDGKPIIRYANGSEFDVTEAANLARLIDCWNACRKFHNPANHIETTNERVTKLEILRKEAWARAVELGANDFRGSEETAG